MTWELSCEAVTKHIFLHLSHAGTSILPPHLDFFNYSKEELPSQEGASKSGSSNKAKRQREGTPDSSSTSSGANEEVAEAAENVITPAPVSLCQLLPSNFSVA